MKLCALDLDGTLLDSALDIAFHVNATLESLGHPVLPPSEIRRRVGHGATALMRSLLPAASEAELDDAVTRYRAAYEAAPLVQGTLFPGARELLVDLQAHHVACALITNKPVTVARAILEQLELLRLFSSVNGAEEGVEHKPSPQMLQRAAQAVGASASETVMLGDSAVDLETALHFGCAFVGVSFGMDHGVALRARGARVCDTLHQAGGVVLSHLQKGQP